MASSQKRFYTIHDGRHLYETIDLDAITYIKLATIPHLKHQVKLTHKIILSSGVTLVGHECRKTEGGKPTWSERLIHAWNKYRKQKTD
jgi:hypothetical protein